MRRDILGLLACPDCRGALELDVESSHGAQIIEGEMVCSKCERSFPVRKGLPVLIARDYLPDGRSLEHSPAGVAYANREYHDRHADTYETDRHTNYMFSGHCQERIESVVKWAAAETGGGSSLDMGCGTGNVLKFEARYFKRAVGVDISDGMMAHIPLEDPDIMLAAVTAAPFADQSFDFISCFSVLHHLYEPAKTVREARRLLKPGGIFYSDWDFNDRFRTRLLFSLWLHELNPVSAFKGFWEHFVMKDEENELFTMAEYHAFKDWLDAEALANAARAAGFKKVHLIYHWNAPSILDDSGAPRQPAPRGIIPIVALSRNPKVAFPVFAIIAVR